MPNVRKTWSTYEEVRRTARCDGYHTTAHAYLSHPLSKTSRRPLAIKELGGVGIRRR